MSADTKAGSALLVVRDASSLSPGDNVIRMRLERLGYNVRRTEDAVADAADAYEHAVIVCSSVVGPPNLSEGFLDLDVPIVVLGDSLYDDLGMTGKFAGKDYGRSPERYDELVICDPDHSMAAGLDGRVRVMTSARQVIWARPRPDAVNIAALPDAPEKVVVFGYDAGMELRDGKAPARRVGMFFERESADSLNNHGWALFDAAIRWAVGDELKQFPEVFREEWQEIKERRLRQRIESRAASDGGGDAQDCPTGKKSGKEVVAEEKAPENLVGLALSGGGIRSATFCLGLLQGMQEHGLLRIFDYLSTVSGGGYLGGWWSAWLARYGQYSQSRDGYPQFAVYDIEEPAQLAALFHDPPAGDGDDLSKARSMASESVKKFFEEHYPGFLDKFHAQRKLDAGDRKGFINCLNNLLLKDDLFGDGLCKLVRAEEKLPGLPELRQKIEESRRGGAGADKNLVRRFNRMLLELVYKDEIRREMFPPTEKIEPVRSSRYFSEKNKPDQWSHDEKRRAEEMAESAKDIMCAGHDPVHHLRLFANYLTPRKGAFSKDTWRAAAVVTRNLVMTWLTLIPLLVAFVLAAQLYFAARPPSDEDVKSIAAVEDAIGQTEQRWHYQQPPEAAEETQQIDADTIPRLSLLRRRPDGTDLDASSQNYLYHDFSYPYLSDISRLQEAAAGLRQKAGRLNESGQKEAAGKEYARAQEVEGLAARLEEARNASLVRRAWWAAYPLAFLLSLLVATTSAWMIRNTSGSQTLGWFGGVAFWVLSVCWLAAFITLPDQTASAEQSQAPLLFKLPAAITSYLLGLLTKSGLSFREAFNFQAVDWTNWAALLAWGGVVAVLVAWAWWRGRDARAEMRLDEDPETQAKWEREVQRTRATQAHTKILITLAVLAAAFLLAGFGHELIGYVYYSRGSLLAKAGGGFGVLATVLGAIFTAVKASPVGGGDEKEAAKPSLPSRIVFALTPPFLVVALALLIAWLSHFVFCHIIGQPDRHLPPLTLATFVGAWLCIAFAFSEMKARRLSTRKRLVALAVLVGVSALVIYLLSSRGYTGYPVASLCFALLGVCFFVPRLAVEEARGKEDSKLRTFRFLIFRSLLKDREVSWRVLLAACSGLSLVSIGAVVFFARPALATARGSGALPPTTLADPSFAVWAMLTTLFCVVLFAAEMYRGAGGNRRPLWLLTCVCVTMTTVLFFSLSGDYTQEPNYLLARTIVGLLALALGLVIALGWLADPNALSMHQFYRDRLVRAYLGASNAARRVRLKQITEAVEGDDVLLRQLKNCQRGAPYHLINTTLNLAAGRDIATAQRSSAMFVLTKRNCGSSRTGYRGTEKYMRGQLSLGTAIAASGAAASPNMGSRTPPASLAMLMTILNVRLGYWAPTPNKDHWQNPQPQLWPFYLLREFLSQTNELSAYSYLTDGGHFDNTGIYSLVERGCRFIVAADCGADPDPCFSDLGDAIRRCRIDFGAEIEIDLKPFLTDEKKRAAGHFAVGTITYSLEHAEALRWKSALALACKGSDERHKAWEKIEERRGVVVLFKPSRVSDESADVQQYAIENSHFPQQTTADQWFDESQFESYRRLGRFCAETAFGSLDATEKLRDAAGSVSLEDIRALFVERSSERRACKGATKMAAYLQSRFQGVLGEELSRHRAVLSRACRMRAEELIAEGASVLDEMGALPVYIEEATANLRRLVERMANRGTVGDGKAGGNGHRPPVKISPEDFDSVRRDGPMFPFF